MKITFESVFEWTATAALIIGVALTSWNIYPANVWVCLIANIMWVAQSVWWRKWSLLVVEVTIVCIYLAGIYKVYG